MDIEFLSIDNFYDDPLKLRDIAIASEYYPEGYSKIFYSGDGPFPGSMSKNNFIIPDIDAKVSKLLNKNLRQNYSTDSSRFRYSTETAVSKNAVHVDSIISNHYAGILYLCDRPNTPGTILYKNVKRNIKYITESEVLKEVSLSGEFDDIKFWEPTVVSYIQFNRLIIYPTNRFHGIGPVFGDSVENSRLVQLFFWQEIK